MSIENLLERIAVALETIAGQDQFGKLPATTATVTELVRRKPRAPKAPKPEPVVDAIPGVEETPVVPDVLADEPTVKTGAELRALAQTFIQTADKKDPGAKNGTVNKLVTFIQSVAKIFNPGEPKLVKIPETKVPEAARMIADWCDKNGIMV